MDEIPPEVPGYRLTRCIGRGGTATVWRAQRAGDEELVAVKLLPGRADEEAVREYSLLQHAAAEHVLTLHEALTLEEVPGLEETAGGPATALVLQLCEGGSLAGVVAERGHLSAGETVTVIAPIARALAGLHALGIVHGDVSPGNVLLESNGRPCLSDLGYARLAGEVPDEVHGTEGFVAPEVLEGRAPTRASDVYSLGALAWQCLAGAPPGHVAERPALADLVEDAGAATEELVGLVQRCLVGDPDQRPEAEDVARAVFDVTDPQPLRMGPSGEVAGSLTRRLRLGEGEGGGALPSWQRELVARISEEEPVRVRWWRRWWARLTVGRRQGRGRSGPARHGAGRFGVIGPGAAARGWLALVGLVVVVALAVSWQQLASAEGDSSDVAAEAAEDVVGTGGAGDRSGAVLGRRAAVADAPKEVASALTELREEMMLDLDTRLLERLSVPGSPAAEDDAVLLREMRTGGDRFRGVDLQVRSARLHDRSADAAVLRAVVDESAWELRDEGGKRERHRARRGRRVDLVLAWHDGRWRVRAVRAVS